MTAKAETAKQLDEYDLQPDELTKEMLADKAGVSIRTVEIWKKEGKLPAQKIRRRIDGVVRKTTIFKTADAEKFLTGENAATEFPKVEKQQTAMQETNKGENDFFAASQMFVAENLGKFAESMNNFTEQFKTNQLPPAQTEKPFLNVKEAADFSGLSESCIRQLVKDEALKKFTGKHGETVVSRKQLINL
jgi:hypothetical protein